jgi:hypothetical protein
MLNLVVPVLYIFISLLYYISSIFLTWSFFVTLRSLRFVPYCFRPTYPWNPCMTFKPVLLRQLITINPLLVIVIHTLPWEACNTMATEDDPLWSHNIWLKWTHLKSTLLGATKCFAGCHMNSPWLNIQFSHPLNKEFSHCFITSFQNEEDEHLSSSMLY